MRWRTVFVTIDDFGDLVYPNPPPAAVTKAKLDGIAVGLAFNERVVGVLPALPILRVCLLRQPFEQMFVAGQVLQAIAKHLGPLLTDVGRIINGNAMFKYATPRGFPS